MDINTFYLVTGTSTLNTGGIYGRLEKKAFSIFLQAVPFSFEIRTKISLV